MAYLIKVVVGDQLTCKNIQAMKTWTQSEVEPRHRLQWAHEVPGKNVNIKLRALTVTNTSTGDFHFLWGCLRVVFNIFWGAPSNVGSLCNMRDFFNRKLVSKDVKVLSF